MADFITIPDLTALALVPDNAELYIVHNGNDYRTTKADFLAGLSNGKQDVLTSTNFGAFHVSLLSKTTIVDADLTMISDSANSGRSKKVTWLNVWLNYIRSKVLSEIASAIIAFQIAEVDNKIPLSQKGVNDGVATLGSDGKIPNNQLPALAITDTFVRASQAAMLLTSTAETGDVCVRTDINKTFILTAAPPSTLSNWQEMLTPTDAVSSVDGQTGNVNLSGIYQAILGYTAANDASVLHKSGAETITGNKLVELGKSFNFYTSKYGIGTPDFAGLQIYCPDTDSIRFGFINSGDVFVEKARFANGNFGINTVSPSEKIDVVGNGKFSGTVSGADATATSHFITKSQSEANFTPLVVPTAVNNSDAVNLQQLTETIALSHQVNITTASLSLTYLEANYSARQPGFEVLCPFIASGAGIYKKMEFGVWGFNTITIVT